MKPVRKHAAAQRDIEEYAEYLFHDSPAASDRFFVSVEKSCGRLGEYPAIGRVSVEMDPLFGRVRSIAVDGFPNHLIFYEESSADVVILRVVHGSMRLGPELLP